MSAARRLPVITSILSAGLAIAATSVPSVRKSFVHYTGLSVPGGTWRLVAIVLAILNVKNLPFVWHIRLFRALLYHLYSQPVELQPSALFLPLITCSWTTMNETDYNFHKSNSTYFSDLDIARTHLVTAILKKGIRGIGKYPENAGNVGWSFTNTTRAAGQPRGVHEKGRQGECAAEDGDGKEKSGEQREEGTERAVKSPFLTISALVGSGNTESGLNTPGRVDTPQPGSSLPSSSSSLPAAPAGSSSGGERRELTESEWWAAATKPGNLLIALGGNLCLYHREIPPFTRYEVWTRILSWDRKWLYVVSHFVEAGAFRPKNYVLQPWKGSRSKGWVGKGEGERELSEEEKRARLRKKVYASSVTKYVVKKGRLTIPPELVLARSEMLPPRPAGAPSTFNTGYMPPKSESPKAGSADGSSNETLDVLEESLFPKDEEDGEWTWEKCEAMRLKGLKLAQHFDALDGLRDVFDGGENGALGVYKDLIGNI